MLRLPAHRRLIAAYTWAVVAGYLVLAVPAVVLLHRIARRAEYAYQGGGLKRELAAAAVVAFHLQGVGDDHVHHPRASRRRPRCRSSSAAPPRASCSTPSASPSPLLLGHVDRPHARARAHYASTTYVAWVLSIPPLLLFAAVGLRMLARKLKWARASRVGAEVELSMTILHALLHAPASRVIRQLLSPLSRRRSPSLEGGTDSNLIGLGTEAWFVRAATTSPSASAAAPTPSA